MPRRATIALAAAGLALAGCGGSGKPASTSTPTSPQRAGTTRPSAPATAPLPQGDAGFLTTEVERATAESLMAGVATARTGSSSVRAYADRVQRERAQLANDDLQLGKKLHLAVQRRVLGSAERDALRALVPLTGARFDRSYLAQQSKGVAADIARAAQEARSASSPDVRKLAAKHLATYHAELSAAQSARP